MIKFYPPFYNHNYHINPKKYIKKEQEYNSCSDNSIKKISIYEDTLNTDFPKEKLDKEDSSFNFFGISLSFDDLLIISLLIILYNEDVKDIYLYITLIILLLTK